MFLHLVRWLDRRTAKEQLVYAGSQYAQALAAGDLRRAKRLKTIIDQLRRDYPSEQ